MIDIGNFVKPEWRPRERQLNELFTTLKKLLHITTLFFLWGQFHTALMPEFVTFHKTNLFLKAVTKKLMWTINIHMCVKQAQVHRSSKYKTIYL